MKLEDIFGMLLLLLIVLYSSYRCAVWHDDFFGITKDKEK